MTLGFRAARETKPVAVYDHGKLVEILAAQFAMQDMADGEEREDEERHDEAEEWIGVNMARPWVPTGWRLAWNKR